MIKSGRSVEVIFGGLSLGKGEEISWEYCSCLRDGGDLSKSKGSEGGEK